MQTPKSSEVLAFCHELFPGLEWVILQDSDDLEVQYQSYSARIDKWDVHFRLWVQFNGSMAEFGFQRQLQQRSLNEQGQTYQQALAGIYIAWGEYCEAMASAIQPHR